MSRQPNPKHQKPPSWPLYINIYNTHLENNIEYLPSPFIEVNITEARANQQREAHSDPIRRAAPVQKALTNRKVSALNTGTQETQTQAQRNEKARKMTEHQVSRKEQIQFPREPNQITYSSHITLTRINKCTKEVVPFD